jgi:hypothetical protein
MIVFEDVEILRRFSAESVTLIEPASSLWDLTAQQDYVDEPDDRSE